MIRIGAQVSQARGFETIIREAGAAGLRALQVFSRNPVGGQSRDLPPSGSLRPVLREAGIEVFFVHAPYFVNPAATDEAMLVRAKEALKQEMRRAKRLSADFVVVHPGHWQERGRQAEAGQAFVSTLIGMLEAPGRVLVENSAGQGKELGSDFRDLKDFFDAMGKTRRVGMMLDTAHAMAAGNPLATAEDVEQLWGEIDQNVGLDRILGIHLNDSLYPVGAHRDHHAHLLTGTLGEGALARILEWADHTACPLVLETPGRDIEQRQEDLRIIREHWQRE